MSRLNRSLLVCVLTMCAWSCGENSSPTRPSESCTITVPQTTIEVGFAGGASSIFVSTGQACTWTVTTSQPFLTVTSALGQTGPGTVNFTVAENNGAARQGTITVGSVTVTINQAAGPAALQFPQPSPPAAVVGAPYTFQLTASGGVGALRFAAQSGTGVPPIGITLNTNGQLSGTPVAPGTSTFGVCVTDDGGRSVCRAVTLVVNPSGTADSPILGNWAGNITLNTGCLPGLPRTVAWSGTIRRASNNNFELVATIPAAGVSNAVVPVTISGNTISFSITVDSRYDFTATFSQDSRSLSGTFTGSNCAPSPAVINPAGTWNATKQ